MAKLYLLTGPAGVGKSTISKVMAKELKKSALIEGDEIYSQVVGSYVAPWKNGNHLDLFWKISIDTIKTYLENGYDVVFNYIIDKNRLNEVKSKINKSEIKFVVLMVDEKTLLERDKNRPEDCQMKDRCVVLLNEFKNMNFDLKNILETTNKTPSECVFEIFEEARFIEK